MSILGFVTNSSEENIRNLLEFKKKEHVITALQRNMLVDLSDTKRFDGIIIDESEYTDFSDICREIIHLKRESKIFIWVIMNHSDPNQCKLYFELGVNGVFSSLKEDECRFTIKNTLECIQELKSEQKCNERSKNISALELNSANLSAVIDGESEVALTVIEYKALDFLLDRKNETISYEEISLRLWQDKEHVYRVANIVYHLRKKLGSNKNRFIMTTRSKGYLLKI